MRTIWAATAVIFAAATVHAQDVRPTVQLAAGWRFHQGDVAGLPSGAASGDGWVQVSVPHSWNRVGHYLPDPTVM